MFLNIICFVVLIDIFTLNADVSFKTEGRKVIKTNEQNEAQWVVFNGIGLTCTEYGMEPTFSDTWFYEYCFGGKISANGPIQLNNEPMNVYNMLSGSNYITNPKITKVAFKSPYDQVINITDIPMHHPIVRIPTSGSTYLYDTDCITGNHSDYQESLDAIVSFFTGKGVAVSFDLHWSCCYHSTISGCIDGQTMLALRNYGSNNGTISFWDAVSKRYADNPYVFYEVYNEPYAYNFTQWYSGDDKYVGVTEMISTIRKNDPSAMIIVAGAEAYAFDGATPIGFYLKYFEDYGEYPTNILYNLHPYQGGSQGPEKALQGTQKFLLSLQTIGPVIFTEFGQGCCNGNNVKTMCNNNAVQCNNPNLSDNYVYNIVNLATQYDVSWMGWAWRGTNGGCTNNAPLCDQPDMRGEGASNSSPSPGLTDGKYGGANWTRVWKTFVSNDNIVVQDNTSGVQLKPNTLEQEGYLPRPCILGDYNTGNFCGFDLGKDVKTLNYSDFANQNIYSCRLVGMPPKGDCKAQGCPGLDTCQALSNTCTD